MLSAQPPLMQIVRSVQNSPRQLLEFTSVAEHSPRAPQKELSQAGSTQPPPHARKPVGHRLMQRPPEQNRLGPHTTPAESAVHAPVAPQCSLFVRGSTQVSAQASMPGAQPGETQFPALQVLRAEHEVSHEPQWSGSRAVSTQRFSQSVVPLGHGGSGEQPPKIITNKASALNMFNPPRARNTTRSTPSDRRAPRKKRRRNRSSSAEPRSLSFRFGVGKGALARRALPRFRKRRELGQPGRLPPHDQSPSSIARRASLGLNSVTATSAVSHLASARRFISRSAST